MRSYLQRSGVRAPLHRGAVLRSTLGTTIMMSRVCLVMALLVILLVMPAGLGSPVHAAGEGQVRFQRIPTQFIAALGAPGATSGSGAQLWGLWPQDPGPRGVTLSNFEKLKEAGGVAQAQWRFDHADWWLEEHGLIMEQPTFPLPPGKYLVTGNRKVTTVLTVHPADKDGIARWELDDHATLYDVTHLACRSARYTPVTVDGACSPSNAQQSAFPVPPGGVMPPVVGCHKQDYAVLIVIAVAAEGGGR